MNIDRAFRIDAISLGDQVGLFAESANPVLADDGTIPVGSIYLQTGGTVWQKWRQDNTWIELSRWPFLFTASRTAALDYIPTVDGSTLSYQMPVAGVVVGLFCQASTVRKAAVDVELWLEGQPYAEATMTLVESAVPLYSMAMPLSFHVAAGEYVQIRMNQSSGVVLDLMVTVLFAQRSV